MPPLTFPLLAGFDRAEGASLQVIDGGLEIAQQMEVIAAARDLGESQLLAGAEVLVGRVFFEEGPLGGHVGIAVFGDPARAGEQAVVTLHVGERVAADDGAVEFGVA
jgi:hypothetical protein